MSPDELMVLLPQAEASEVEAKLNAALEGAHMLAVDVSDARANYALSGDAVRDVIAKIAPVDMGAFGPGEVRRTRFGQVAAALWMEDETTVRLFCFRSVADYMFELLTVAADTAAPVHYYQA
jgi:sarcosine oxidase subunit gamma